VKDIAEAGFGGAAGVARTARRSGPAWQGILAITRHRPPHGTVVLSVPMTAPMPDSTAVLARRRLWLGALHHLALADGDFSEAEANQLEEDLQRELPGSKWEQLALPGNEALVHRFGVGTSEAEEFLRSAVLVALADGHLSPAEMVLLRQWAAALQVGEELLACLPDASCDEEKRTGLLDPLKAWLDRMEPREPAVARFLVRLIPAQCPFERDLKLFGHKLVHIPPMCKINPLYEQLVALRLRALDTLAGQEP
jgi:tellurite resistance protein